jgi:3'-5' exoribonuclease
MVIQENGMNNYEQKLINIARDLQLDYRWIWPAFDNGFTVCSGSASPDHHHYGDGGLIKHTYEVVNLCMIVSEQYPNVVCKRQAYIAALYHDYGKTYDYERNSDGQWCASEHKYKIHHIPRSYHHWQSTYEDLSLKLLTSKFSNKEAMEIGHAILAHHGHHEYHSPVEPRTKLAFLLHYCDAISARMDDCNRLFKGQNNV